MKRSVLVWLFLFSLVSAFAQPEDEYKPASKASQAYHEYRMYASTPPYGLARVKKLISQIKGQEADDADDGEWTEALDAKTYNSLSLREKFTYTMLHGESFSQICDAYPPAQDEQKKIFGVLPDFLQEQNWSERQKKFLHDNRDSVMAFIRESITRSKRMGVNYKRTVQEINAVEMIPFLTNFYKQTKKDGDILTVLLILMKENKYQPFVSSATYKKLYGEEYNFNAFIDYNKANEELIIKRATDFFHARPR